MHTNKWAINKSEYNERGDSFDKLKQKHRYNFNQNNYSDHDQIKVYIILNTHWVDLKYASWLRVTLIVLAIFLQRK